MNVERGLLVRAYLLRVFALRPARVGLKTNVVALMKKVILVEACSSLVV